MNVGQEDRRGGRGSSLWLRLLLVMSLVALVPLIAAGAVVAIQTTRLHQKAQNAARIHERRAESVARRVTALLLRAEQDLQELARLPRESEAYVRFARERTGTVWRRSGSDESPGEERLQVPLYREVAFADAEGLEVILVVRGQPAGSEARRRVSDPQQTTFRSENYFNEAMRLGPGQIYVSRLTGWQLNKIEALGVEKLLLRRASARDRLLYRYVLYQLMQEARLIEYLDSFQEYGRTVLVFRRPGDEQHILVEQPQATPAELQARKLELKELLEALAPEDTLEGRPYDGVIRFATAVAGPDGRVLGVVSLALDHLHLQELTQHIKAMELDAVVFAGYRDADYTFLVDDQGWIITHPKAWNIRGLDSRGRPVPAYSPSTSAAEELLGLTPLNLSRSDWKLGEGYHQVVEELLRGHTGTITATNLAGVMRTQIYSPIFYSHGEYAASGIFGGVLMGTRSDKFIGFMQKMSDSLSHEAGRLLGFVVWILLGTVLMVLVICLPTARSLARPIWALTGVAEQMAAGNLEAETPEGGPREIRILADTFRRMAENLKNSFEELEQKNRQLHQMQQKLLEAERAERARLEEQLQQLKQQVARASFAGMIVESSAMKKIQEEIIRVAPSSATVLILGENGTGKELVAEAIHSNSPRRERAFVKVNCAAFNENLLESELFGHVKGAYTGATASHKGLFESANGGTLLLDEVGDMSPGMQKKLLRVLQEGELVPVGGTQVVKVDVRVIAATNRDLQALMREGKFREDLFHRLNVIRIEIPPLRERREDILPLARSFVRRFAAKEGKPPMIIDPQAERLLCEYSWPGNVRELENAIERAVIRALDTVIRAEDFQLSPQSEPAPIEISAPGGRVMTLEEVERAYILRVLDANQGNKKLTAKQLDIGYNTLWRKLKQYGRE